MAALIGAFCCVSITFVVALLFTEFLLEYDFYYGDVSRAFLSFVITWILLYAFVGGIVLCETSHTLPVTRTEVAAHFGLQSGVAYPLKTKENPSGVTEIIDSDLRPYTDTSRLPHTGTLIGFTAQNGKTYQMGVPSSAITFVQRETKTPTMTINLDNGERLDKNKAWKNCKKKSLAFSWGWFRMRCDQPGDVMVSSDIENRGLAPIVEQEFSANDGANITVILTPKQYNELLRK